MANPFETTNLKGVKINRKGDIPSLEFGRAPADYLESYQANVSIFSGIDNRLGLLDAEIDKLDKEGLMESIERDKREAEERVNKKSTSEKIAQWTSLASTGLSALNAFSSLGGAKKIASTAQAAAKTVDYSSLSDKDIEAKISTLTNEISTAKADLETSKGLRTTKLNEKKEYNNLINDNTKISSEQSNIFKEQNDEYKTQNGIVTDAISNLETLNTAKTSAETSKTALEEREHDTNNPLSAEEKAKLAKLKGPATQEGSVAYIKAQITQETARKSAAEKARTEADNARKDAATKKAEADGVIKENTPKWEKAQKDAEECQTAVTKKEQEIKNKETELQNLQAEQTKRTKKTKKK